MNQKDKVYELAKRMADRIGHGMAEKCTRHAEVALEEIDRLRAEVERKNVMFNTLHIKNRDARLKSKSEVERLETLANELTDERDRCLDLATKNRVRAEKAETALTQARKEGMREAAEIVKNRAVGWRKNGSLMGGTYAVEARAIYRALLAKAEEE